MKAILVIDMPSSCTNCPCAGNNYDYNECEPKGKRLALEDIYEKRPSWCPLKPMPSKKEPKRFEPFEMNMVEYNKGYRKCYNACIDEILGDKE